MKSIMGSLRGRLVLLNLASALPALLIILYFTFWLQQHEVSRSESHILSQARILAGQHEQQVEETRQMLAGLSQVALPSAGFATECRKFLEDIHMARPSHLHGLFIATFEGKILCTGQEGLRGAVHPVDLPPLRPALEAMGIEGSEPISRLFWSDSVLVMTQASQHGGKKALLLGATLNLSWLRTHPQLRELPEGAAYMLLDPKGNVLLSHPDRTFLMGKNVSDTLLWKALLKPDAPATFSESGLHGESSQIAHVPLGPADAPHAHLLVSVPMEAAAAGAHRLVYVALACLALASVLGLGLGWVGGSVLVLRPLRPAFDTIRRLAGGDLAARTAALPGRPREIVRLAAEIDRMAEALSDAERERARTHEVLRCERDRAQAYLDVVGVMVVVFDERGCIALANHKACEILQYPTPADCLGADWFERHAPPEQRATLEGIFRQLMAGEQANAERFENEIVTCTGERRMIAWHNTILRDARGRPVSILSAGEDITDRRAAEEQLRAARQMLELVTDTIPHHVFWKDRDSRYLGCNAAFARDAGLASTADIVGKTDHELSWHEEADRYRADDAQVLLAGVPKLNYEELQTAADGRRIWREISKVPLRDAGGEVIGVLGLYRDVTARKQLEEERERLQAQLQQAQKMEVLGQFTGGIGHDFNNMLGSILGFAKLALQRHVPDRQGPLAEYLGEVIAAGERARDLIVKMLAFSRTQPARGATPHAPEPLVRDAMKMLASSIPSSVLLTSEFEEGLPAICIDPVELHQILLNLVLNARDAMAGRGRLFIGLRRVRHSGAVCSISHKLIEGDFVELVVSDSGPGIAAGVLPRIFEPFFTTKAVGLGSGMGLAMVHGLVSRARGHILVETWEGEGTTFRVLFPISVGADGAAGAAGAGQPSAPSPRGRGRVLVVDDEQAMLRLLCATLEGAGYRVEAHSNPLKALAAFRTAPGSFIALVADQTMPHLSGVELFAKLRQLRPELPGILCTGYSDSLDEATALEAGVQCFFHKPLDPDEILKALAEAGATIQAQDALA